MRAGELKDFYEQYYDDDASDPRAARGAAWRRLCADGKAEHVERLSAQAGLMPHRVLDVGCGDGTMLERLATRGFAGHLEGAELSARAAQTARARPGVAAVTVFDGERLPFADGAFDLGTLSHVLEHVPEPGTLLRETARVCRAVVLEVPLEDNRSARRPGKRVHADEIGHLQRFSRDAVRRLVRAAGLTVAADLVDALPREVQGFWATTPRERLQSDAKWLVRQGLAAVPPVGLRLITVHYAALCLPGA